LRSSSFSFSHNQNELTIKSTLKTHLPNEQRSDEKREREMVGREWRGWEGVQKKEKERGHKRGSV